jgi:hypothetical protein
MPHRPLTEAELISLRRSSAMAPLSPAQVERLLDTLNDARRTVREFGLEP